MSTTRRIDSKRISHFRLTIFCLLFFHHFHPHGSSLCLFLAYFSSRTQIFRFSSPACLPFQIHRFQMSRWPVRPLTGLQWLKSVLLCRVSAISRIQKVTSAVPRTAFSIPCCPIIDSFVVDFKQKWNVCPLALRAAHPPLWPMHWIKHHDV